MWGSFRANTWHENIFPWDSERIASGIKWNNAQYQNRYFEKEIWNINCSIWFIEICCHENWFLLSSFGKSNNHLTFCTPCISESCIKIEINLNLYFHISLWCITKGFTKAFKAFIKPFEAPQRCVKVKV